MRTPFIDNKKNLIMKVYTFFYIFLSICLLNTDTHLIDTTFPRNKNLLDFPFIQTFVVHSFDATPWWQTKTRIITIILYYAGNISVLLVVSNSYDVSTTSRLLLTLVVINLCKIACRKLKCIHRTISKYTLVQLERHTTTGKEGRLTNGDQEHQGAR